MIPSSWNDAFLYLAVTLFCVVVLLILSIWSIRRHRDPILHLACASSIEELIPSLAGLTLSTPVAGNAVEVLENGAFFDALLQRILSAKQTVHLETFLWHRGTLGQRITDALSEQARAGKQVRVLIDALSFGRMGKSARHQMEAAGCKVAFFHKKRFRNIGVLNDRDHRKLVIIDGREAFVGGHCIKDHWLGDAQDSDHYGDISVRLQGPIVHSIQSAFSENWTAETGELFIGDDVFPSLVPAGDILIHAAFVKPEGSAPAVKILHHTAICMARRRIWIQNPYFIPRPEAIDALGRAVSCGVDVRVMVPAASVSDNRLVQHAAHRNYEKLLKCGVRLFEYRKTLLHQKVMTIDGIWSAVGTSNFDDRSFETNDELTLGIKDAATAQKLDAIFMSYLPQCREISLDAWRKRGVWHKLIDNGCYILGPFL